MELSLYLDGKNEYSFDVLADGALYLTAAPYCHCAPPPQATIVLNANDGSVRWKTTQVTGDVYEQPRFVTSGLVYTHSDTPSRIYALSASGGSVQWPAQITDTTLLDPTVIGQDVYLGAGDGVVSALNGADGTTRWHTQVGQADSSIGNGAAVAGVVNGLVYLTFPQGFAALNASDGSLKWQYQASGIFAISAVTDGVVYASTRDIDTTDSGHNKIYTLDAGTGALIWRYDAPEMFFSPVVGLDLTWNAIQASARQPGRYHAEPGRAASTSHGRDTRQWCL